MNTSLVRWFGLAVVVSVVVGFGSIVRSQGREDTKGSAAKAFAGSGESWEYLVVSGLMTNLEASSSGSSMRKGTTSAAGREQFAVERNLDKLGSDGWELVSVAGPPMDPIYYLKRRKS